MFAARKSFCLDIEKKMFCTVVALKDWNFEKFIYHVFSLNEKSMVEQFGFDYFDKKKTQWLLLANFYYQMKCWVQSAQSWLDHHHLTLGFQYKTKNSFRMWIITEMIIITGTMRSCNFSYWNNVSIQSFKNKRKCLFQ